MCRLPALHGRAARNHASTSSHESGSTRSPSARSSAHGAADRGCHSVGGWVVFPARERRDLLLPHLKRVRHTCRESRGRDNEDARPPRDPDNREHGPVRRRRRRRAPLLEARRGPLPRRARDHREAALAEQEPVPDRIVWVECEYVLARPESAALDLGDDRWEAGNVGIPDDASRELRADDAHVAKLLAAE